MRAYNELYLDTVRTNIAVMVDLAVNGMGCNLTEFYNMFAVSDVAWGIEHGDPGMLAGHSGGELLCEVLSNVGINVNDHLGIKQACEKISIGRSAQYWLGWAIAYYQWQQSISFLEIADIMPVKKIEDMYAVYHEMDILKFTEMMEGLRVEKYRDAGLKQARRAAEYTQRILSSKSGVPLRTIQQYEQGQKDIKKAQVDKVAAMAKVLGCEVADIIN